ncbi:MAG: hypothetical protein KBC47_02065 [Candidatus Peribacteraceae bacterium]|nr:hypothetical protein [Candidatus Peribacteraceae bacterium]
MGIIFLFLGIITPRFTIALLWLMSNWFEGVFDTRLLPIIGFFIFPITLLWYSAVMNWFNGEWDILNLGVLVLALILDLSSSGSQRRKRERS